MTERVYYRDPYCRRFDARVTRVFTHEGRAAVTLDRTAFYPTSGGQPFDTGRIALVDVLDVVDLGDEIAHIVTAGLEHGAAVTGEIDWPRRFDHMQQHTGQHVLSAAFDRLVGNPTMSFHMGTDAATIDLQREATAADVERAIEEANRIVWEDRPVSIRTVAAGQANALPLRKESSRQGALRLIEIEEFDLSACGGTHVARTGAIGLIAATNVERLRGGSRVTFVCGRRALVTLRALRDAVAGSVRQLSVLPAELPAAIQRLQAEGKEARKALQRMQASLATHEAGRLLAESPAADGRRVAVHLLEGWDAVGLKSIASAMIASGATAVALISGGSPAVIVIACAPGTADAGATLRSLIDRFGGRGGGKPDLAQGGIDTEPAALASAARALL